MSRPQKIIPPVKGSFNSILRSVAMGSGAGSEQRANWRAIQSGQLHRQKNLETK